MCQSECPTHSVLWIVLSALFSVISHCCEDIVFFHLKEQTPDTNCCLVPKSIMYANPPFVNRNSVQCI